MSKVQNYIAQAVARELSDKIHSKVNVGTIDYQFFNVVSINDLYVEDLHKDTLLYVKKADANFDFWKIIRGKVLITSIEFDHLSGHLKIDKSGGSNLDFILQAFKKPPTKDSSQVEYKIGHFRLKNSSFSYTNFKNLKNSPRNIFNGNRLIFNAIQADISIDVLTKDSLSARISKLSAVEQSGLVLTDLTTQIFASQKGISLPDFDLRLPNSRLHFMDVFVKYDSLADMKQLAKKFKWNVLISPSSLALSDLSAFAPDLKNVHGVVSLKGLISGRISSLRFQKMEIKYGKSFVLRSDLEISGLPNVDDAFIYGQINELSFEKNDLQDFISDLSRKPFVLPRELNQLGRVHYKGNVTGFLSNLVAYGNFNTSIGSVSTDILLKFENKLKDFTYNGTVKSNNLQLGRLLSNNKLGKASFSFNTKGSRKEKSSFQGTITAKIPEIEFNNYSYRDIQFGGKYDGKGFDGTVDVADANINARFAGKIDMTQKLPVFDFDLMLSNADLHALNFTPKYEGALLSFSAKMNMLGNSLDNINGFVRFDGISFVNKAKTLHIAEVQFVSRIENGFTRFAINSDYVNGSFSGNFSYSTIGQTINKIVQNYLPALTVGSSPISAKKQLNHVDVDLQISNTQAISEVFDYPYSVTGVSTIKGYIDEKSNRIDLFGNVPMLKSSKQTIENVSFHCENPKQQLQLTSRAQLHDKNGLLSLFLHASASKDSVYTQLGWQNAKKVTTAGDFKAVTKLWKEGNRTAAQVSIFPTQVIISDSIWNIHPCKIDLNGDSTINIHNFRFDTNKQFVHINGVASKSQQDGVSVEMNAVSVGFVMNLLKLKGISIDGSVTGKATLFSLLHQPIFEANLSVQDLQLNHKWVGNGTLFSTWDKQNSQLLARGAFVNEKKDTIVVANAVYTPRTDSLNVIYNTRNFSVEFLTPYFESVVQNVKGYLTGKIRMFGALKAGIRFEGDAFLNKGQMSVKMLKTSYFFNDSVHMTPKAIEFRNVKLYDQERNSGTLNATLAHNGFFQHLTYNVTVKGRNLLGMNTQAGDNDYFFGKAYANGTVRIYGDDKVANIWVNAVSQPQTKCYVQMGGVAKASDNSFIKFVNKRARVVAPTMVAQKPAVNSFNVKVNLQIEATSDAEMQLIIDPKAGDMIAGKGNGNLRVEFDSFTPMKLYGTYAIHNGYYLFTLQNVIRKEFKIDNGSTIAWTGDPFNAQVNIRALYPLTASLKDLMDNTQSVTRTTVPVNCVLKLTENLMKPTVNFEIDLPSSDEVVKQQVRSIINTDEMMNRQIIYLLVFNKFFAPANLRANTSIASNEGLSLAVSTASAQLNSLVSQMLNTNKISFGFDYRQKDQVNTNDEFQTQILLQPNNRWIVNGNVGYRYDNQGNAKFIGDVDVEYLLTESGKFRVKGYNHTIDRYQLRDAKTTQGAGLLYKEDFASVDDLFKYYWRLLTGKGKKKTNDETTTNND